MSARPAAPDADAQSGGPGHRVVEQVLREPPGLPVVACRLARRHRDLLG